jgi:DUF1680 family protein
MPEFAYSIAPDGLYVNLFESSTIDWTHAGQPLKLQLKSEFPFKPEVELRLTAATPARMKLRVRVPQWAAKEMAVLVNGTQAGTGKPGSFVTLERTWKDGDTVAFRLPMDFRLTHYTGIEKVAGREQFAIEYGPILLALVGKEPGVIDEKGNTTLPASPGDIAQRLRPKPGAPLHFTVDGAPHHEYIPYWQLGDQLFTCYPVLSA